jgi:integrase
MGTVFKFKLPDSDDHKDAGDERIRLHDGKLAIYRRNKTWHYSIKTADGHVRKSTEQTDKDKAIKVASDAYSQFRWRVERGLSVKSVMFTDAATAYLKELERIRTTTPGKHSSLRAEERRIRKYIAPYFEPMRLTDIRQRHVTEFHTEYLNHYHEAQGKGFGPQKPGVFSRRLCESAILSIFRHAVGLGMISNAEMPAITRTKVVRNVRGDFKPHEEGAIFAALTAAMTASRPNLRQARANALLYWYCRWLRVTGMRPGVEVLSIVISEIEYRSDRDPPDLVLHVRDGKVGGRSVIVRQDEVVEIIDAVKALHRHPITPTTRLFNMDTNKRSDWFGLAFGRLLRDLNLHTDTSGASRSLYSWRHSCITDWVRRGRTLSWIAANCGTSVHQIESTYSHVLHSEQSSELRK